MRFRVVCALAGLVAVPGCTGQLTALRQDVDGLKARVAELDRVNLSQRARLASMDDRILLMQDQLETQRLAVSRIGAGAPLPVPAPASAPAPTDRAASPGPGAQRTTGPSSLPVVRLAPTADDSDAGDDDSADDRPYRGGRSEKEVSTPDGMSDVYSTLDEDGRVTGGKGASRPSRAPKSASVRPAPKEASRPSDTSEDAIPLAAYRTAYETYQQGRLDDALAAFRAFVKSWPKHPYSDNAQYWVGECLYDRKQWEEARREFMRVVTEHPDGNKVPDAMVKVGLCAQRMQQPDEARRMYDAVMLTFPDSPAAAVAMRLLGEMP